MGEDAILACVATSKRRCGVLLGSKNNLYGFFVKILIVKCTTKITSSIERVISVELNLFDVDIWSVGGAQRKMTD